MDRQLLQDLIYDIRQAPAGYTREARIGECLLALLERQDEFDAWQKRLIKVLTTHVTPQVIELILQDEGGGL